MSLVKSFQTMLLERFRSNIGKMLKPRPYARIKLVSTVKRLPETQDTQTELSEQTRAQPSAYPEYVPPGHYYSPLLDIDSLGPNSPNMSSDGVECWENIDLHPLEQRSYYEDLIDRFPALPFPSQKTEGYRYFADNEFFNFSDAFTLSGIIRKEKPRRIVEIGSGFSSAVMLDTLSQTGETAALTFIEPFPHRLDSVLLPNDRASSAILARPVQEVLLSVFDELDAHDILFIDSSHVAKIGSDVTIILLRILPRLKPGVVIHFHDIFYPASYPISWIREGRAWNESIFLRAFLVQNRDYKIIAFNAFAAYSFPELFRDRIPNFGGGSIWLRKEA
jgi:hypothetical protein